jgi:hypothetical protein
MKSTVQTSGLLILLSLLGACSSSSHGMQAGTGGTGAGGAAGIGGSTPSGAGGDTTSGDCTGEPEYCVMYSTQSACQTVGCSWDATTPLEFCDGTGWPCSRFTTSSSCVFAGCEWLTGGQPGAASGGSAGSGGGPGTGGAAGSADAGASGEAGGTCDGSAMDGTWYRALDGLSMILLSDGCAITGTADNSYYRHVITGTFDDAARTMTGKIKRTNISSGCTTFMATTWLLTDSTHFTMTITSTDGACDLSRTYGEQSVFVRK